MAVTEVDEVRKAGWMERMEGASKRGVSFGVGMISFLQVLVVGVLVIGLAWIVCRPVLGISLLVGAGGILVFVMMQKKLVPASAAQQGVA